MGALTPAALPPAPLTLAPDGVVMGALTQARFTAPACADALANRRRPELASDGSAGLAVVWIRYQSLSNRPSAAIAWPANVKGGRTMFSWMNKQGVRSEEGFEVQFNQRLHC